MVLSKNLSTWVGKRSFAFDGRSIRLFRIALGILILLDLGGLIPDLEAHYTAQGLLPSPILTERLVHQWDLSLFFYTDTVIGVQILFLAAAIASIFLIFGWRSRWMTVFLWVFLLSLHHRNHFILSGADSFLIVIVFWSLFLPLSGKYKTIFSFGSIGYTLQIICIYLFTAIWKSGAEWTSYGTAVQHALALQALTTPFGNWLGQFSDLCKLLTWSVLIFEFIGPFLLLILHPRVRLVIVSIFILFQLGISFAFRLGLFPWISIVAMIPFIPCLFWEKVRSPWSLKSYTNDNKPSTLAEALALLCCVYIVFLNINSLPGLDQTYFRRFNVIGNVMGISQKWAMFAPAPSRLDKWNIAFGANKESSNINLILPSQSVMMERPSGAYYLNSRWRSYYKTLSFKDDDKYYQAWSSYMCQKYNLTDVNLIHASQQINDDLSREPTQKKLLYFQKCLRP